MPDSAASRFIGGSPLTVLIRLGVVSLLVGALMSWLGIDAIDVLNDLERGLAHLYGTGFAALREVGRTFLAGVAVVLPVWVVLRLLSYRGPKDRLSPADHGDGNRAPDPRREAPRWSNPERVGDERRP